MSLKPRRNRKANPVDIQEEGFKTPNTGLKLKVIKPKTDNQAKAFAQYEEGKNLLLGGAAGSGKTLVSLYLALKTVMDGTTGKNEVHIIRSVVPTRDIFAINCFFNLQCVACIYFTCTAFIPRNRSLA